MEAASISALWQQQRQAQTGQSGQVHGKAPGLAVALERQGKEFGRGDDHGSSAVHAIRAR